MRVADAKRVLKLMQGLEGALQQGSAIDGLLQYHTLRARVEAAEQVGQSMSQAGTALGCVACTPSAVRQSTVKLQQGHEGRSQHTLRGKVADQVRMRLHAVAPRRLPC